MAESGENAYLAITDGLHDGVEPTGREVVNSIVEDPIPGVCPIWHMHPEAVRAGQRFIAAKELGSHFTQRVLTAELEELDRDEVAARRFMDAPLPPFWLGIDPHDSPNPNANSLLVDERFTARMIAVAGIMGLDKVVSLPEYPFLSMNPEFVGVETERAPATNPLSQAHFWRECLSTIVELGPEGMDQLGLEIYRDLKYFFKTELVRVDDDGDPDLVAIERIKRLECTPSPGTYFAPFEPSHPIFSIYPHLSEYEGRLCVGYWGDDKNNSKERSDILGYLDDGRPRKIAFASLLLRATPPQLIGTK
jgi:hypothetical protein